jgi:hypothetical protein
MCNRSKTPERAFKLAFLFGKLSVLAAFPTFLSGLATHSDARIVFGILAFIIGIMSAWTGRLGLFWLK